MRKNFKRSDIPYADRLLMDKYRTLAEQRNEAARIALQIACVALNNTEGLGYTRLSRFAQETERLINAYYADPETEAAHLADRLASLGFLVEGERMYALQDENGVYVKKSVLETKTEGC